MMKGLHTNKSSDLEYRCVEPFFQDFSETGLRMQVEWCKSNLALTDQYYSSMLHTNQQRVEDWLTSKTSLSAEEQEVLKDFWRLHLHLRTFYNSNNEAVRNMYEHVVPVMYGQHTQWSGTSIKDYIEANGRPAIKAVQVWLEALRVPSAY